MIGISMGDANGVGPEILLRAYLKDELQGNFIIIGDYSVLQFCNDHLSLHVPLHVITGIKDFHPWSLNVLDLKLLSKKDITIGNISKKTGKASIDYVKRGTVLALEGKIQALVTLPINKEAVRLTMKDFTGHTGYIASLCKTDHYTMMLVTEKLIVTHVSTHVSLKQAIRQVKKERIYNVIHLTHEALNKLGRQLRIAVAGLNPHAGENNAFGNEDSKEIAPAIVKAKRDNIDVSGPFPADTIFFQAVKGLYNAVVCMYHDQGHIPIKLLDFESAVNVTLGLPIIRTSVDHGTAYDIAYQGIASTISLRNACLLALKLSEPVTEK